MTKQQIKRITDKTAAAEIDMERLYKAYYQGMITYNELNKELAGIIAINKDIIPVVNGIFHVLQYGINTSNIFRIAEIMNKETTDYKKLKIQSDIEMQLYEIQTA